jgi:hypothetical protein
MTRQYLLGEMSVLLAELETLAAPRSSVGEVARLRRAAETSAPAALGGVAERALEVSRVLCWESFSVGDMVGLGRQATLCAELHDFGVCAGLLDDDQPPGPRAARARTQTLSDRSPEVQ